MNQDHIVTVLDHGWVRLTNIAGPTRRNKVTYRTATVQTFDQLPTIAARFLGDATRWPELEQLNPDFRKAKPGDTLLVGVTPTFDADDTDVANAARMSFDGSNQDRTYADEMRLTNYLMKNQHSTPFEAIVVWLDIKLPIFVARQFIRHRTQAINEISGRYITLPAEWYIPELGDIVLQSKDKKQGGRPIDLSNAGEVEIGHSYQERLQKNCERSYASYQQSIDDGIAMEQARLDLHVNHYTRWLSTMNLRNLLHFISLRDHPHAQAEARKYAKAITNLVEAQLPGIMQIYHELKGAK